jgi:hypothetical protein
MGNIGSGNLASGTEILSKAPVSLHHAERVF